MLDLVIAGGGPAGLKLASQVSKNLDVTVFEEHYEIGAPNHCTGLLSTRTFDLVKTGSIMNKVRGAEVEFENKKIIVEKKGYAAYVVDRVRFDKDLAIDAIEHHANLVLKSKLLEIREEKDHYKLKVYSQGEIKYIKTRYLIGADGVTSTVRRFLNFKIPSYLNAVQSLVTGLKLEPERVKVIVGNKIAPGFFGWIVPIDDNSAKVGLAVKSGHAYEHFKKLMKHEALKNGTILRIEGGAIPMGMPEKSYHNNVLLIGDAGGFVKATSGGGVYMGLKSSIFAAKAIDENIMKNQQNFSNYENYWKNGIGKELKRDLKIHRLFASLRDKDFELLFDKLKEEENIKIINSIGDIDYPSKVATKLIINNPWLLKFVSKYINPFQNKR